MMAYQPRKIRQAGVLRDRFGQSVTGDRRAGSLVVLAISALPVPVPGPDDHYAWRATWVRGRACNAVRADRDRPGLSPRRADGRRILRGSSRCGWTKELSFCS